MTYLAQSARPALLGTVAGACRFTEAEALDAARPRSYGSFEMLFHNVEQHSEISLREVRSPPPDA